MQEKEREQFQAIKELIVENLESLETWIDRYEEIRIDPSGIYYQELETLIQGVDDCKSYEELEAVILQGKSIEHNLDVKLSQQGITQMELSWPEIGS